MQQLFSEFPDGRPGVATLLLRAVVASVAIAQGGFYLSAANAALGPWIAGVTALVLGIMLIAGLLTPIAAALAGLGVIGVLFSVLPASTPNLFDEILPVILAVTILLAIALLGPGAFSVDARLFGRREIIIPAATSASKAAGHGNVRPESFLNG